MADKTATLCVRVAENTRQIIEREAERDNTSLAEAAETLILRGVTQGCTPQEVQLVVDGMAEAICAAVNAEVRSLADAFDQKLEAVLSVVGSTQENLAKATQEMKLAEKNIGSGTQASLATLAFIAWYGKPILKAVNIIAYDGEYSPERYVADNVRIKDLYNWFWNVGGALRRNPSAKNLYPSFRQTPQILKDHDLETLTGIPAETWEKVTAPTDAEAIANLAKNNPSTKRGPQKPRGDREPEGGGTSAKRS